MIVCELCVFCRSTGECQLGVKIPKAMSCGDFAPGLEKFCSNPNDFVSSGQVVEMATFFGIKGRELKLVKIMGAREESARLKAQQSLA